MKRLAILVGLVLLALPVQAQQNPQQAPPPKAAPRVAVPPAPPPAPPPFAGPSLPPLPPRSPLPNSAADAASAQCSAQCNRAYYTCMAGDSPEACSADWAQCRVGCGNAARRSSR